MANSEIPFTPDGERFREIARKLLPVSREAYEALYDAADRLEVTQARVKELEPHALLQCHSCKLLFDPDVEGRTDEVNECDACGDARAAYELRHAHPSPPTSVEEYRRAKGER